MGKHVGTNAKLGLWEQLRASLLLSGSLDAGAGQADHREAGPAVSNQPSETQFPSRQARRVSVVAGRGLWFLLLRSVWSPIDMQPFFALLSRPVGLFLKVLPSPDNQVALPDHPCCG